MKILNKIEQSGFEAYIVGGFVRDMLFYKRTNDIDIATNALPKDLIAIFGPPNRKIEYGSYHMIIDSYTIDITTYRKEEKYEEAKPLEFSYSNNLLEDAKRRDFRMNAIYMNKLGHIIDPFNGRVDIDAKILRTIGNPKVRFEEDPSRILRSIRFASIYHLRLDKSLVRAIEKTKKNIEYISLSKVRKELDAILLSDGFPYLKKLGLLGVLGITTQRIVYVEDISGLWAQIETKKDYITEKELKKNQKEISEMLKCGTISMLDLYRYGIYECKVAANIMHFKAKRLNAMIESIPIKSRHDIVFSSEDIQELSGLKGKELGDLLKEIEEKIVLGKLRNSKEEIIKYLNRR